jgi:hypothetical protein
VIAGVADIAGALGGSWAAARLFHLHGLHGVFNLSTWLTAIAGRPSCSWPITWSLGGSATGWPTGEQRRRAGPAWSAAARRKARDGHAHRHPPDHNRRGLRFALAAGSPHGLNLYIAGVILMFAGLLGLLLPPLARGPLKPDRQRRWVRPG